VKASEWRPLEEGETHGFQLKPQSISDRFKIFYVLAFCAWSVLWRGETSLKVSRGAGKVRASEVGFWPSIILCGVSATLAFGVYRQRGGWFDLVWMVCMIAGCGFFLGLQAAPNAKEVSSGDSDGEAGATSSPES